MQWYTLLIPLFAALPLSAQFGGGPDDGHDLSRTTQSDLTGIPGGIRPLYGGGPGDGHDHLVRYASQLNGVSLLVLYAGGRGDGHDRTTAATVTLAGQSLTVLFAGGAGDGHDYLTLGGAALDGTSLAVIYAGGQDDGHDNRILYEQSLNGALLMLYAGGAGDGHERYIMPASTLDGNSLSVVYGGGFGDGYGDANNILAFIPLPLTLISFDATDHGDYVLLEWVTEDEVDTELFTIQKTVSGLNIVAVGNLAAAGYTPPGERRNYHLRDDDPWSGTTLYRLRTTDFDGVVAFSDFVSLTRKAQAGNWDFDLFPNPSTGTYFNLRPSAKAGDLRVQIFDAAGKAVATKSLTQGTADQTINLDRRLPPGAYVIRATDKLGRSRTKILLVGSR